MDSRQINNHASLGMERELILQSPGTKAVCGSHQPSLSENKRGLWAGCLQEKHGQNEGTHVLLHKGHGQAQRGCLQGFFCDSHFGGGRVCREVDAGALHVPPECCACVPHKAGI